MQMQSLKYIAEIAKTGSINKAAQNLYISQPHLSRILKEVEQTSNIVIFQRTHKGVELTFEGQKFMEYVYRLLEEYQNLEEKFFLGNRDDTATLKVATERYSPMIQAFLIFYNQYCRGKKYINLALYEDTMENIVHLVGEQIYNIGVVHVLKSNENDLMNMLRPKRIRHLLLEESLVHVQINTEHPFAGRKSISVEELQPYPHVTFADECVSNINYCCDIQKYNKDVQQKRIIVQDRGTLHSVLSHTDGYHLGTDVSFSGDVIPDNLRYIPLEGSTDRILTYWIYADCTMTEYEQALLDVYRKLKAEHVK